MLQPTNQHLQAGGEPLVAVVDPDVLAKGDPMSINARCGSCNRELLLGQLVQPSNRFRCPVCGFAFAPAYATVAPGVAARVMAAQEALVTALAELGSMTGRPAPA